MLLESPFFFFFFFFLERELWWIKSKSGATGLNVYGSFTLARVLVQMIVIRSRVFFFFFFSFLALGITGKMAVISKNSLVISYCVCATGLCSLSPLCLTTIHPGYTNKKEIYL